MENTNQKMVKTGDENPVNRTSTKITSIEELYSDWKRCYIIGVKKNLTRKELIEGYEVGLTVRKNPSEEEN